VNNYFWLGVKTVSVFCVNAYAACMMYMNGTIYWRDAGEWYAIWMLSIIILVDLLDKYNPLAINNNSTKITRSHK
jgi:hypothetical protein